MKKLEQQLKEKDLIAREKTLVGIILGNHLMDKLYDELPGGYMLVLEVIANSVDAWCEAFKDDILNESADWEEISESNGVNCWDDLAYKWCYDWIKENYINKKYEKHFDN